MGVATERALGCVHPDSSKHLRCHHCGRYGEHGESITASIVGFGAILLDQTLLMRMLMGLETWAYTAGERKLAVLQSEAYHPSLAF